MLKYYKKCYTMVVKDVVCYLVSAMQQNNNNNKVGLVWKRQKVKYIMLGGS